MATKKTAHKKGPLKKRLTLVDPPAARMRVEDIPSKGELKCLKAFGEALAELRKQGETRNPTVREVSIKMGATSPMAAQQPLNNLADKGFLQNEMGWCVIGKKLTPNGESWLKKLL